MNKLITSKNRKYNEEEGSSIKYILPGVWIGVAMKFRKAWVLLL